MQWRFGVTGANEELRSIGSAFLQLQLILDKGNTTETVNMGASSSHGTCIDTHSCTHSCRALCRAHAATVLRVPLADGEGQGTDELLWLSSCSSSHIDSRCVAIG